MRLGLVRHVGRGSFFVLLSLFWYWETERNGGREHKGRGKGRSLAGRERWKGKAGSGGAREGAEIYEELFEAEKVEKE